MSTACILVSFSSLNPYIVPQDSQKLKEKVKQHIDILLQVNIIIHFHDFIHSHVPTTQEIYRPGTAISDASNVCTAVGGDQNKEFRGKTSIMRGAG